MSAFDTVISKGGKVEEKNVENLMEILMSQLVKLDAISGDGEVKMKKKIQVLLQFTNPTNDRVYQ